MSVHKIIYGKSETELKQFEDNSFDSCVTDPPYELNFMNRRWDSSGISFKVELWEEVYRVMKPGSHILVAGIARTHHRMWVALEDAGFEIRDGIYHIFGSGFPKSTDISKQLDKMNGKEREVIGEYQIPCDATSGRAGKEYINKLGGGIPFSANRYSKNLTSAPASQEATQWDGWGTALKPAVEIWCLARKPISERNIASNVLKWGTGGINVDGCRIKYQYDVDYTKTARPNCVGKEYGDQIFTKEFREHPAQNIKGRFPANLILECCCEEGELVEVDDPTQGHQYKTESNAKSIFGVGTGKTNKDSVTWKKGNKCVIHTNPNCVCKMLDEQSGELLKQGSQKKKDTKDSAGFGGGTNNSSFYGDKGGSSRFFYQAKASQNERWFYCTICKQAYPMKERDKHIHNAPEKEKYKYLEFHPTQKPLQLIQYLTRLITPPHGTILDPFMGTGTILVAAEQEGFNSIGVDSKLEYCRIAERRLKNEMIQLKISGERSTIEKTGF